MKTLKFLFASLLVIQSFAGIWFAQSERIVDRELSIQISGFGSLSDRFVFRDHNSQDHVFDSNGTKICGRFPVGSAYSLTQTSGPRQCRMTNNQGTVPKRQL